jgi:hypothetical protein
MTRGRLLLLTLAFLAASLGVGAPSPATAQVIKPYGMPIPSFFFPAGEKRAREACADNLPSCRATVRAQMEFEMAISLIIPWIILGVGIVIALMYLRKQEQEKKKARDLARRHHDPGAFRKLDKEKSEQKNADDDDEELS